MTVIQASIAISEIANTTRDAISLHASNCYAVADEAERKSGRKFTKEEYQQVWVNEFFWPPKPIG